MAHILEGEWTGYTSAQRRVVHREVIGGARAKRLRELHTIVFTDGTSLILRIRARAPREKPIVIDSYGSLIREAEAKGGSRVLVTDLVRRAAGA